MLVQGYVVDAEGKLGAEEVSFEWEAADPSKNKQQHFMVNTVALF